MFMIIIYLLIELLSFYNVYEAYKKDSIKNLIVWSTVMILTSLAIHNTYTITH